MQRKKNGLYDAMWGFCLKISEKYWIRHAEGHYSLTAALTLTNKIETPVQIKIAHSNIKAVFFFFLWKIVYYSNRVCKPGTERDYRGKLSCFILFTSIVVHLTRAYKQTGSVCINNISCLFSWTCVNSNVKRKHGCICTLLAIKHWSNLWNSNESFIPNQNNSNPCFWLKCSVIRK